MCGSPATDFGWRDPGFLHTAILRKLTPGTKYFYRYGNDEVTGFSEVSICGNKICYSKLFYEFLLIFIGIYIYSSSCC